MNIEDKIKISTTQRRNTTTDTPMNGFLHGSPDEPISMAGYATIDCVPLAAIEVNIKTFGHI